MNVLFDDILEDCLARIQAGASLADCLRIYPDQAAELSPLLETFLALQTVPIPLPRSEAVDAGRRRMLSHAYQGLRAESIQNRLLMLLVWILIAIALGLAISLLLKDPTPLPAVCQEVCKMSRVPGFLPGRDMRLRFRLRMTA